MKRALVVLGMIGLLSHFSMAQKPAVVVSEEPGWHKIGEISASFKLQSESIVVLGADKFEAVKLKVTDAPINIEHMQIVYEGGETQEVNVASPLDPGAETRVIDLTHPDMELSKVVFTYKTLPNYKEERADVELYGLKKGSESYRDDKNAVERGMEETTKDVERAANGEGDKIGDPVTDEDVDRKTDEASDNLKEESREVENDIERDTDEASDNLKEESREVENDVDRETNEAVNETEKAADETGNEIKEAAGKLGAEIEDKPYVDKVGPDGQRIYMDKHSKYYYINENGDRVYITKEQMKDNPDRD